MVDDAPCLHGEVQLRGEHGQWHWSLTWFANDVDNLINWDYVSENLRNGQA